MSVFLDTNIVVYLVEQPPDLGFRALRQVGRLVRLGEHLVVSQLVRMECLVQPYATGDRASLAEYEAFFASGLVTLAEVSGPACVRAARLRGLDNLEPMDALHVATAIELGCDALLTNDARLRRVTAMNVVMLEDAAT